MSATHVSGLVSSSPAAWATSGRHLIVPFGRILRVYDVTLESLKCIAYLQGHSGTVVAVVKAGNMRVASASEDGTVRVWDISDGTCLRTIDLGQRIVYMCAHQDGKLLCFGLTSLTIVSLSKGKRKKSQNLGFQTSKFVGNKKVASSADGKIFAVLKNKVLNILSWTGVNSTLSTAAIRHYSSLTALCISEDGSMLAVGDSAGIITVYPNPAALLPASNKKITLNRSKIANSTLHWHSSPVRGLAFAKDGRFLFSGGTEAALVTWKMTRNHFGARSILPRLRAPILSISMSNDDSTCAITQADNSVRLVNMVANEISTTIRGISASIEEYHPHDNDNLTSRASLQSNGAIQMTQNPRHEGQVAISGNCGKVQMFDIYKGNHVLDMNVIPRNLIYESMASRDSQRPHPARVTAVAFHSSGKLMVTVEEQNLSQTPDDSNPEQKLTNLRFWNVYPDNDFKLTSVCSRPHGLDKHVSSVCFHPHLPIAVTTSLSGNFKIWRALGSEEKQKSAAWRTESQNGYKGLPCSSACFSSDGSLLAVGCGSVLTLWHIEDLLAPAFYEKREMDMDQLIGPEISSPTSLRIELLHALVHPPAEECLHSVRFVFKTSPFFVTTTESGIYIWNAMTQGIWWSSRIRMNPRAIAVDKEAGNFAVVVQIPATSFGEVDDERLESKDNSEPMKGVVMEIIEDEEENHRDFEKTVVDGGNAVKKSPKSASKRHWKRGRSKLSSVKENPKHVHEKGLKPCDAESVTGLKPYDTESAIAIFDVTSPCPLRVLRMPTGVDVASLEFVSNPDAANNTEASLVCIDTNLEVSFYRLNEDDDGVSTVTSLGSPSTNVDVDPNSMGKLELLLGSANFPPMRNNAVQGDKHSTTQTLQTTKAQSLESTCGLVREFFDGPLHIQASVSAVSADFIRALRGREMKTEKRGEDELIIESMEQPNSFEQTPADGKMVSSISSSRTDFESCLKICSKLVERQAVIIPGTKKKNRKKKKGKELKTTESEVKD